MYFLWPLFTFKMSLEPPLLMMQGALTVPLLIVSSNVIVLSFRLIVADQVREAWATLQGILRHIAVLKYMQVCSVWIFMKLSNEFSNRFLT